MAAEQDEQQRLIEAELEKRMLVAAEWRDGEDGREAVLKHRWYVTEEDEDNGLFEGDEGTVSACVVGSAKYRNTRVSFSFTPDGCDGGSDCIPLENVDAI